MIQDCLLIRDLKVFCTVGVYEWEQRTPRPLTVQLRLELDLLAAGKRDALAETVDYAAISKQIVQELGQGQFKLIEAVADKIATICLQADKVLGVRVVVEKPRAMPEAEAVAVEIYRTKSI
jgi:dihydroneopterin aldolase